jgi:peptidase M50
MNFNWTNILYSLPGVIIGLTVHEFSHAFVADKLGDGTARAQGRLTLNPFYHIDPIGMVFILLAGFGWAKPVQFDMRNLKSPKRDRILIALAGPLSNLILGVVFLFVIKLTFDTLDFLPETLYVILFRLLFSISVINLGLFIFNMLPIPPLDGSHVFLSGLNLSSTVEQKITQYGTLALFAIITLENIIDIDLLPIGTFTHWVVSLVFR